MNRSGFLNILGQYKLLLKLLVLFNNKQLSIEDNNFRL